MKTISLEPIELFGSAREEHLPFLIAKVSKPRRQLLNELGCTGSRIAQEIGIRRRCIGPPVGFNHASIRAERADGFQHQIPKDGLSLGSTDPTWNDVSQHANLDTHVWDGRHGLHSRAPHLQFLRIWGQIGIDLLLLGLSLSVQHIRSQNDPRLAQMINHQRHIGILGRQLGRLDQLSRRALQIERQPVPSEGGISGLECRHGRAVVPALAAAQIVHPVVPLGGHVRGRLAAVELADAVHHPTDALDDSRRCRRLERDHLRLGVAGGQIDRPHDGLDGGGLAVVDEPLHPRRLGGAIVGHGLDMDTGCGGHSDLGQIFHNVGGVGCGKILQVGGDGGQEILVDVTCRVDEVMVGVDELLGEAAHGGYKKAS
mmetsp:Transcript_12289/g.28956  ORF Transcript_12289/g.28956 Transcript_12289/m.28956 type:complete len:371 (-) Transcript_12289:78-1190(-)